MVHISLMNVLKNLDLINDYINIKWSRFFVVQCTLLIWYMFHSVRQMVFDILFDIRWKKCFAKSCTPQKNTL